MRCSSELLATKVKRKRRLTQVLPVLRLQSDLQQLVLKDDAVVLTNKPVVHEDTVTTGASISCESFKTSTLKHFL